MNDQDYVRLDPSRMGFRVAGRVPEADHDLLRRAFEALRQAAGPDYERQTGEGEIFWLNVWQEDSDDCIALGDEATEAALDRFARAMAREHAEPGALVDGYGFVVNPTGSKTQVWHVDYTTDAAAIWIPLTPFTEKNATQFVTLPATTDPSVLERVAMNVDQVDFDALVAGVEHLSVQQIAAKPMTILSMGRGTIHRGITNTGREHRVAFYVSVHYIKDYANYPYPMEEEAEPGLVHFHTPSRVDA